MRGVKGVTVHLAMVESPELRPVTITGETHCLEFPVFGGCREVTGAGDMDVW